MFPAQFDYQRAHSIDEAISALASHGDDARVLAGGQSLIPAMRYRLARPAVLIDINPIEELVFLRESNGFLCVGAGTRDFALEVSPLIASRYPLLADTSRARRRSGRASDGNGRRQPVPQRSRRRLAGYRACCARPTACFVQKAENAPCRSMTFSSIRSRRRSKTARWRPKFGSQRRTSGHAERITRSSARSAISRLLPRPRASRSPPTERSPTPASRSARLAPKRCG